MPTTFEVVTARATVPQSSCLVVAFYRTGPVVAKLFQELADVLYCVATSADQLLITGYGLSQCVVAQTHDAGDVAFEDIEISDHRLLSWAADIRRPPPLST
jgi:hypothetical protein